FDFNDSTGTGNTPHADSKLRVPPPNKPLPASKSIPHVPSGYDPVHPTRSHSSASSSAGGTNVSQPNSPHPPASSACLAEVKREQEALKAEQLAHDGDDEEDEEEEQENSGYRRRTWRVPSQTRRTKINDAVKPEPSNTNSTQRLPTPEPAASVPQPALASTRPRRQHPRIDGPNPYVLSGSSSSKRRKMNNGCYHSKLSIHGRRNVLELTKHNTANSTNPNPSRPIPSTVKIDGEGTKRRTVAESVEVNTNAFINNRETRTSKRKSTRSARRSSSSRTRHDSSSKPALKCRIRVPRSSLSLTSPSSADPTESNETSIDENNIRPTAFPPSANEPRSIPPTSNETASRSEATAETSTNGADDSILGGASAPSQSFVRLSTESKNTSAMTDSSGASALEISH
ncbi:unnamed protein product, partial [Echinostoma caproni]|uniref:Serine/arginine repetitive matrix protein 2 n=1 Tax=Echinostoma caproni TaxID=27848 RepID=A0A183AIZ4_9TREM